MSSLDHKRYLRELRLFLEDICCNIARFQHVAEDHVAPEEVRITQESYLGSANGFADIRVQVKENPPYFIEIDYGYTPNEIVASLTRKYCPGVQLGGATKIIIVMDTGALAAWPQSLPVVQPHLQDGLQLEIWDEQKILSMLQRYFAIEIEAVSEQHVSKMYAAVDIAKGKYAFDDLWAGDEIQRALIWHFGFWKLKQLRAGRRLSPEAIIPPALYENVAVVMADICSFCSYMRDTRQDDVIRDCLTTFYSKARYAILNTGGMLYQFVGDEVIGLYGIPEQSDGYLQCAFDCARALLDIGNSVSGKWQRQIDNVQSARGLHIGIAIGDMQIVSLEPFRRSRLGGLGEVINIAARLLSHAGPGEIMVSNTFYEAVNQHCQAAFQQCEPLEARHMGMLQAWKVDLPNLQLQGGWSSADLTARSKATGR